MNRISENQLRSLLRSVFNAMPFILVYVDGSGRMLFWNDKASEMSAIETDAAHGRVVWEILPLLKST